MTDQHVVVMRLWLLVAVLSVGCTAAPQESQILDAPVLPFDELFAPADTVRLDPSIIIGAIMFLDVNQEGDLLVTDFIGGGVNLFASSGEHIRTYSPQECLPDDEDLTPFSARFADRGHVVTKDLGDKVVVLTADGRCVSATRRMLHRAKGFCASGDSLFFLVWPNPWTSSSSHNSVVVYSPELQVLRDIPVEWPKFPRLNVPFSAMWDRSIDCFGDGPYFTYLESMDAIPVRFDAKAAQQRPEFYSPRPQDLQRHMSREEMRAEYDKYLTTSAVFALTSQTRMVVYSHLADRWRLEGIEGTGGQYGISVASNVGRFPPRSTISPVWPDAAGNGYIYSQGDHEPLADGDVGNPLIFRYRFIPPQDADE